MTPYTQAGNFVCSQYDVGRECQITLQDENGSYTIPTGATVTIQATKPSGFGFSVECTWSGSVVTFATTETMTSEFGRFPAELRITSGNTVLGTTNFYFKVERSPHPEGTVDGDAETAQALTLRVDALEGQMATVQSDITDVKSDIDEIKSGGGGLTADIKSALLQIAQKVAYIDEDGQDYYDDLYDALYAITAITLDSDSITLQSIGATSQLTATTTPAGGNVTWLSSNTSVATVSATGLVTSVAYGSATITATAGSVSATCSVTVAQATCTGINATYTQSGTVFDTATLDSLKSDLVVTASWSNGTTSTLNDADYTLSGTLAEGTSTITVSYGGQTDTFNVTVTHYVDPSEDWSDGVTYTYSTATGCYIDANNGSEIAYETWNATPYLGCKNAGVLRFEVLIVAGELNGANGKYNAFYDEQKNFISSFTVASLASAPIGRTLDIPVPSNAAYVRASAKDDVYNTGASGGAKVSITPYTSA